ncbi:hypothetical protein SAMN05661091_2940 [Paenibacillus uliginis N3/975]|uniref:Uncharacterized protein n=1 Tax=Paenibacillus uliginis N3/975 TaxID=1313296 RepID=A0A1X7HEP8_9BACL|nr:hypothetical protein SAMN05661091_2940 [Paenibacillus uliginis N3/975]
MEGYEIQLIPAHAGGRNVAYNCEKGGDGAKILRIAFLNDRSREDFLGEVEYIRYLFEHGGSVSDVVSSLKGNLLEEITHNIIDAFEVMRNNGEEPECDEELSYRIKCMEDDIPYLGFFHRFIRVKNPLSMRNEIFSIFVGIANY